MARHPAIKDRPVSCLLQAEVVSGIDFVCRGARDRGMFQGFTRGRKN